MVIIRHNFERRPPKEDEGPLHQSWVSTGQVVSEKILIDFFFADLFYCSNKGHLGQLQQAEMSDKILKRIYTRIIPTKFGSNWPSLVSKEIKMRKAKDDGR